MEYRLQNKVNDLAGVQPILTNLTRPAYPVNPHHVELSRGVGLNEELVNLQQKSVKETKSDRRGPGAAFCRPRTSRPHRCRPCPRSEGSGFDDLWIDVGGFVGLRIVERTK